VIVELHMYGIPSDLDLSLFQGAELIQICLGEFQIQFHFHPKGMISAEGKWELRNASEDVIDQAQSNLERDVFRLQFYSVKLSILIRSTHHVRFHCALSQDMS
jgi:hypothetical protein